MLSKKKEKPVKVKEIEIITKGEWMQKYWRPCAAFMYIACCIADFAVFPIMFTVVQFWETQAANDAFRQWVPITLQGGGLFHVSMCAVLGVSAYGRTQEKLAGASANSPAGGLPSPELSSTPPAAAPTGGGFGAPAQATGNQTFGSPAAGGFGTTTASNGFGTTPVSTGFGGKKVVPEFPQPTI